MIAFLVLVCKVLVLVLELGTCGLGLALALGGLWKKPNCCSAVKKPHLTCII